MEAIPIDHLDVQKRRQTNDTSCYIYDTIEQNIMRTSYPNPVPMSKKSHNRTTSNSPMDNLLLPAEPNDLPLLQDV